jgi:N6-adenosine-specific RNA methylase IME4
MNQPKPHRVILADPPWRWRPYSKKGLGRSADAHYDTMTIAEIKALPVADWAAPSCVLFLWITDPVQKLAHEVIEAWGFTYKTVGFYWVKTDKSDNYSVGNGKWTRSNPEQCLLATRGPSPKGGFVRDRGVEKLIIAPRGRHSVKPAETHERIERLCAGPYLELFARQRRAGWDFALSDQIDTGPTARRWKSNSYPGVSDRQGRFGL